MVNLKLVTTTLDDLNKDNGWNYRLLFHGVSGFHSYGDDPENKDSNVDFSLGLWDQTKQIDFDSDGTPKQPNRKEVDKSIAHLYEPLDSFRNTLERSLLNFDVLSTKGIRGEVTP